jgi:hypothetical protein
MMSSATISAAPFARWSVSERRCRPWPSISPRRGAVGEDRAGRAEALVLERGAEGGVVSCAHCW